MPVLRDLAGKLNGRIDLRDLTGTPQVQGELTMDKGTVELREIARLADVSLKLKAEDTKTFRADLGFRNGKGKANIGAGVVLSQQKAGPDNSTVTVADLDLSTRLKKFPILVNGRKMGDATLTLDGKGNYSPSGVVINPLALSDTTIALETTSTKSVGGTARPDDIVFIKDGKPIDEDEAKRWMALNLPDSPPSPKAADAGNTPPAPPLPIDIRVKAPRNIWVRGPDANIELGMSDDFRVKTEDGPPRVYGTVFLRRGNITAVGPRLDIQKDSGIIFSGPADVPNLDVHLSHLSPAIHPDTGDKVTVFLDVTGSPADFKLASFRAEPALTETECLAVLLTGKLPGQDGEEQSSQEQAMSIAGGLIAAQLRRSLMGALPVDVLSIGADQIAAGMYLTDRLYVEYTRRIGQDNQTQLRPDNINEMRLEYQLSRRWSFESLFGDAAKGGADLFWKKRY